MNRASNDIPRASFTPEELCSLTIQFYRRNYIEGLFLSSGVLGTPDHTMELFYQTLYMLRYQYQFNGYVHVKTIPGADGGLIRRLGYLADRMSVNLEISSQEGLKKLAPHKTHASILTPIRQIQNGILHDRLEGRRADAISGPINTIEQPVLSEGQKRNKLSFLKRHPTLNQNQISLYQAARHLIKIFRGSIYQLKVPCLQMRRIGML